MEIRAEDSTAIALMSAIHSGDVDGLRRLLAETPALATARIIDDCGVGRTLLLAAAD